jgi:SNF2 family DNA or RNA helicase
LRLWIEENPKQIFNALSQMTRLRQAAFSPELYGGTANSTKIDQLKEDVRELVASGEKAIIFTSWKKAVDILVREMAEYNPAVVTGAVPVQTGSEKRGTMKTPRQDEVDKFNNDPDCKLFIGTLGACKEGFTLSAGTYVLAMDEDWVPANNMQAYARSAAGGLRGEGLAPGTTVNIIIYRAADTIEQWIAEMLIQKQKVNDRMTEMDGGAIKERVSATDIRDLLGR